MIKPLLKCRKRIDEIKTEWWSLTRDKFRGDPVCCLNGLRHRGGMNLIQAFVWNVGTYVLMLREQFKWKHHEGLSTNAAHRGGLTRSSCEVVERQWSEGVELSVILISQPLMGMS